MRKRLLVAFVLILVVSNVGAQVEDWPLANAGGYYTVLEGDWLIVDASGSHGMYDQDPNRYVWDLDNNGEFETEGFSASFDASGRDGTESQVVGLEVCYEMACDSDVATIDILNVAPVVDAGSNATIYSGQTFSLASIFSDQGVGDSHTATVNYDNTNGNVSASVFQDGGAGIVTGQNTYYTPRVRNVRVCVSDDDGGTGCDSLQVNVMPVPVQIDIKPYYNYNTFNLEWEDPLGVVLLSSATFDATGVNPYTVSLEGAPRIYHDYYDYNTDGRTDLVVLVWIDEMQITRNATQATAKGETYSGVHIEGTDAISIVPPRAPTPDWSSQYPTLRWGAVNGGVCYQVQIDNDADFSSPAQISTIVEGTEYNTFPLYSGHYYWRVRVGGLCINVIQGGWSVDREFDVP